MMKLFLPVLAAFLAPSLFAQVQRPSVEIDTTSTGNAFFFSLVTEGETSVVVYGDEGATGQQVIYASTSDGRGVNWSAPIAISNDPTNAVKFTSKESAKILDGRVYAVWVDERVPGTQDLYLNTSDDGGNTWNGEVLVPKPFAGLGELNGRFDFDVRLHPNGNHELYFLYAWDPGGGFSDLYLTKSADGGMTFEMPRTISASAIDPSLVGKLDIEIQDDEVHVAWYDSLGSPIPTIPAFRTYYQKSADGGQTWLPSDTLLTSMYFDTGNFYDRMGLRVEGDTVAVFWQAVELFDIAQNGAVRVAISTDGGASFGADEIVGGYVPDEHDIDRVAIQIVEGNVLLAWNDNRTNNDELYVQRRAAGGTSWTETQLTNGPRPGGGFGAELVKHGSEVFLLGGGPGLPNGAVAVRSTDSGASWGNLFELFDHPGLDLIIFVDGAYNELYDNLIMGWNVQNTVTGDRQLRIGGFRQQTLEVSGFDSLSGAGTFKYSGFRGGVDTTAFALLSGSPGNLFLPYPSMRNLGVTFDSLALSSLGSLFLNTSAILGPGGDGVSIPLAYSLTGPATFYAVGVALDFSPGEVVGLTTDIVSVSIF